VVHLTEFQTERFTLLFIWKPSRADFPLRLNLGLRGFDVNDLMLRHISILGKT
jgi:hypothetical protein